MLCEWTITLVVATDHHISHLPAKGSMEAVPFKVRRLARHVVSRSDMGFNQIEFPNQLSAGEISDGLLDLKSLEVNAELMGRIRQSGL